jgi:hypothetical protein
MRREIRRAAVGTCVEMALSLGDGATRNKIVSVCERDRERERVKSIAQYSEKDK